MFALFYMIKDYTYMFHIHVDDNVFHMYEWNPFATEL